MAKGGGNSIAGRIRAGSAFGARGEYVGGVFVAGRRVRGPSGDIYARPVLRAGGLGSRVRIPGNTPVTRISSRELARMRRFYGGE